MASDSDLGQRVYSNADGDDGRVQSKIVGATSATLSADAAYQAKVDADGNLHVDTRGNAPIGDVGLQLTNLGAIISDGVYEVTGNPDPSNIGLVALVRDATPGDSQQTLRLTAKANTDDTAGSVRALDMALHDADGNAFSLTNPLPTFQAKDPGTEVHDQDTQEDLASAGSDSHLYTVPINSTFSMHQVLCEASGDARYEILIGDGVTPVEGFVRKAMRYSTPSKAGDVTFDVPIDVVTTTVVKHVKVTRKNLDNKQQDVHSTIIGILS